MYCDVSDRPSSSFNARVLVFSFLASPALRADTLLPESWIQLRELVLSPSTSLPSPWAWCQIRSFGRNKRDASNAVASGAGPSLFTTAHACLPGTAGGRFCAQVDGLSMVALVLVWRRADGVGGGGAHTTTGTSLSTPPGQEGCNRIFRPVDRRIQACSSEWVVVLMTCGSELDVVEFISDC